MDAFWQTEQSHNVPAVAAVVWVTTRGFTRAEATKFKLLKELEQIPNLFPERTPLLLLSKLTYFMDISYYVQRQQNRANDKL